MDRIVVRGGNRLAGEVRVERDLAGLERHVVGKGS